MICPHRNEKPEEIYKCVILSATITNNRVVHFVYKFNNILIITKTKTIFNLYQSFSEGRKKKKFKFNLIFMELLNWLDGFFLTLGIFQSISERYNKKMLNTYVIFMEFVGWIIPACFTQASQW